MVSVIISILALAVSILSAFFTWQTFKRKSPKLIFETVKSYYSYVSETTFAVIFFHVTNLAHQKYSVYNIALKIEDKTFTLAPNQMLKNTIIATKPDYQDILKDTSAINLEELTDVKKTLIFTISKPNDFEPISATLLFSYGKTNYKHNINLVYCKDFIKKATSQWKELDLW